MGGQRGTSLSRLGIEISAWLFCRPYAFRLPSVEFRAAVFAMETAPAEFEVVSVYRDPPGRVWDRKPGPPHASDPAWRPPKTPRRPMDWSALAYRPSQLARIGREGKSHVPNLVR
jgi:hypothetical protein